MQALGVEIQTHVNGETSEALAVGQQLLARIMPPALRTLAYESSAVCLSCMQFLNSFLARVKNVSKRQGGLDDTSQQQLLLIMQACFRSPLQAAQLLMPDGPLRFSLRRQFSFPRLWS